jgi:hypothetical protein
MLAKLNFNTKFYQKRMNLAVLCRRCSRPYLGPVLWIPDILVRIRIRGSVPLTYGSGSCSFRQGPSSFFAYYFLKEHLHHFLKIKSTKLSHNSRNQGFFYYFCLMMEGSRSGRSKNISILWILILIHNTA